MQVAGGGWWPLKACSQMAPSCSSHPTLFACFMSSLHAHYQSLHPRVELVRNAPFTLPENSIGAGEEPTYIIETQYDTARWVASSCSLNPTAGSRFLGIELMVALLIGVILLFAWWLHTKLF